ncbi:hypothetical protein FIBSPDRAFT_881565 [Athelia psychrophila]|uniref:F-box domain-containing protein n=1 Tax=Athelia psychrophila TaxID=1759441 RepID=A0A166WUC3_9AGAM|nr:hypothetical protein FIBSPDRAFT_964651 [Fibularhizoctonia sp. CBS 109695]KZP34117.1 hypothetical protein FIBSPDRAFT_881565 [Fibularhizoctonia sp. CBS 109695]
MSHVLEILQQASNIATLKICSLWHRPGPNPESTILTHPNISTLEISSGTEVSNKYILDGLALPALRILSLSKQWRCATSLLSRSACNLASLDTRLHKDFDIEELVQLPLNNSLTHWQVSFVREEEWETMVECLTRRRNTPPFNNLRSLKMNVPGKPRKPIDMAPFADMVASRWRQVDADLDSESARCAPLSQVRLDVSYAISIDHVTISHLQTFAAEGLDISIRSAYREQLV